MRSIHGTDGVVRPRTAFACRSARGALLLIALTALTPAREGSAAQGTSLEGTWYVLIHYKNSLTNNPHADRWLDLVWTFRTSGDRLEWTQYPIVVFEEGSGRFERTRAGKRRSLGKWEPDEAGWSYLAEGPRVNSRGSKSKALRGSDARGWNSSSRGPARSANVFTYEESWSISSLASGGIIRIDDVLSSGAGGADAEETTEFRIAEAGPDELRGSYDRDGTRVGTFRMTRVGAIRGLKSSEDGRTPNQRAWERERQALLQQLKRSTADGSVAETQWPWDQDDTFPTIGASLAEVTSGLRALPEANVSIILQKLQIFRIDVDPWQEISEKQARSEGVDPVGTYAVMAARYCRAIGEMVRGEWRSADWFLLERNALAAYEYDRLEWMCAQQQLFHPAGGDLAEKERQVTGWMERKFPKGIAHPSEFYQRGLSYVSVGRIDDAEKMLAEGRAAFDSTTSQKEIYRRTADGHEDMATDTEENMLSKALERAIGAARGNAGGER